MRLSFHGRERGEPECTNCAKKCQVVNPVSLPGEVLALAVEEGWRGPEAELLGPLSTGFLLYQAMLAPGRHWHSAMTPVPGTQSAPPSPLTGGKLSPPVGAVTRPQLP